jgi:hypothetical protein
MSRHITDLHTVLAQLIVEHRRLLELLDAQHAAMKVFDLNVMADLMPRQEMARLRIIDLENKRRWLTRQIAAVHKLEGEPRLSQMAQMFPQHTAALLKSRDELRDVATQISRRSQTSGRLASAVLGHLNTVVRLLASAAQRAGLYTRRGIPRVGSRIGVMDAVG